MKFLFIVLSLGMFSEAFAAECRVDSAGRFRMQVNGGEYTLKTPEGDMQGRMEFAPSVSNVRLDKVLACGTSDSECMKRALRTDDDVAAFLGTYIKSYHDDHIVDLSNIGSAQGYFIPGREVFLGMVEFRDRGGRTIAKVLQWKSPMLCK